MRLPRFRVRTLMITVAVVAIVLGFWKAKQRWTSYKIFAKYHAELAVMYREAESGRDIWFKQNLWIESKAPEHPPLSPWDSRSFEAEGMKLQAEYHAKISRCWEARW